MYQNNANTNSIKITIFVCQQQYVSEFLSIDMHIVKLDMYHQNYIDEPSFFVNINLKFQKIIIRRATKII